MILVPGAPRCVVLGAGPACLYCCQRVVRIDVAGACAITQFVYRVEFGCRCFVFLVWIRLVLVDVARRTIREEVRTGESNLLIVLLVAAQARWRVAAMVHKGW
jgi:hypothetical protein